MARILVIEDVPNNMELARKILVAHGYEVLEAEDAETGFDVAVAELPDLILMDLGLPDTDGQTLVGWMRRTPSLAHTPIIAFTAWPEETARTMVSAYGCDDYISKPITLHTFVAKIAAHLPPADRPAR